MTVVTMCALALAAVGALNFIVNPLGDYPLHVFTRVSTDARDTKLELLDRAAPRTRVLILGSSRAMKISPALIERITGMKAFNACVETAMMEDVYAMLRYTIEQEHAPIRLVILGIDVEAFHNHRAVSDRLMASPALRGYVSQWNTEPWIAFTRLFTASQTYYSLLSIDDRLRHRSRFLNYVYDANGYLHYPYWERKTAQGEWVRAPETFDLNSTIASSVAEYHGRFLNYTAPSEERVALLRRTIAYCRAHGIRLKMFITPVHPTLVRALAPQGFNERRGDVIAVLRALTGDAVADFTDPSSYGGDLRHFYDGAHVDEENADRIVRRLVTASDAVQ